MSKRWWIIIGGVIALAGCGACLLFGGLAAILGSEDTSPSTGNESPSTDNEPPPAHQVGQDVIVGKVRWKVVAVENLGSELKSDNQFVDPLTSAGHFFMVRVEVENRATEARTFAEGDIVDSQGRTFGDSADAIHFIEDNERCILESLNPNLPRICTAIYEVPTDATGLKLFVGDLNLFGGDEAYIDLGMR